MSTEGLYPLVVIADMTKLAAARLTGKYKEKVFEGFTGKIVAQIIKMVAFRHPFAAELKGWNTNVEKDGCIRTKVFVDIPEASKGVVTPLYRALPDMQNVRAEQYMEITYKLAKFLKFYNGSGFTHGGVAAENILFVRDPDSQTYHVKIIGAGYNFITGDEVRADFDAFMELISSFPNAKEILPQGDSFTEIIEFYETNEPYKTVIAEFKKECDQSDARCAISGVNESYRSPLFWQKITHLELAARYRGIYDLIHQAEKNRDENLFIVLGCLFMEGTIVPPDGCMARSYFTRLRPEIRDKYLLALSECKNPLIRGQLAELEGSMQDALKYYTECNNSFGRVRAAYILARSRNHRDHGIAKLRDEGSSLAHLCLGHVYMSLGNESESINEYETADALGDPDAMAFIGDIYYRKGEHTAAKEAYMKSWEKYGNFRCKALADVQ